MTLCCKKCGKVTVIVTKGKVKKNIVTYCWGCDVEPTKDMPDFMKGLFGN